MKLNKKKFKLFEKALYNKSILEKWHCGGGIFLPLKNKQKGGGKMLKTELEIVTVGTPDIAMLWCARRIKIKFFDSCD